jgi:lysine 2,3-aminomutase
MTTHLGASSNEHSFGAETPQDDWTWQIRNSIRTLSELNRELATFTSHQVSDNADTAYVSNELFDFRVTPHVLAALKQGLQTNIAGAWNAFHGSFVPTEYELERGPKGNSGEADSIGEDLRQSHPAPSVTRFYRNRALLRISHMCPAYCRYCFRRRLVGDEHGAWNKADVQASMRYISTDTSISEVIISGGEPLILGDEKIGYVLDRLSEIDHIRRIRIDSKALTILPQRVTNGLVQVLRRPKLNGIVGHFTHLYELTKDVTKATSKLTEVGIPVYAHVPLLKSVNDDEVALASLMETLVDWKIRPYYLIHYIPTAWTEHFRVSIARGLELMDYLQRNCTGLAIPTFIVYLPSGEGKIQLSPSHLVRRSDEGYIFRSHNGTDVLYREPILKEPKAIGLP